VNIDIPRAEKAIKELLLSIGEDPDREGLKNTPKRVAAMCKELLAGMSKDPAKQLVVTFMAEHDEMVMIRDIPLASVCEHHLLPFIGKAHIAYIPDVTGRVTGLSKLARLVDLYAKRLQLQERLTTQIADTIEQVLVPRGVLVVIEAEHLCMSMRGVNKPGSLTITSAVRGMFKTNTSTRVEAMQFIQGGIGR
jgi:GTP cyclohydrolase I